VDLCLVESEELKDVLTAVSMREDTSHARTTRREELKELQDVLTVGGRREDTQQ